MFIGGDPAGGGNDLHASKTMDLSAALAGIPPHPVQGHHVKLTVDAPGSIGNDTKSKVFWVEGCGQPPTTTTTPSTTAPPPTTTAPAQPRVPAPAVPVVARPPFTG